MSEKNLARVFYADLWGLREEKYRRLFENDVKKTKWQKLEPAAPYYFFVPKDFALQVEYEKFWKVTDIFKEWSSGVKTHRDHFVVGFTKEEIVQRLRVFTGNLSDELVKESLKLKDTKDWKLKEARENVKKGKPENKIYSYAYRPFNNRKICYELSLIDRGRWDLMKHLIHKNIGLTLMRRPIPSDNLNQFFVIDTVGDINFYAYQTYFFPLYLYPDESVGAIHELPLRKPQIKRVPNFTPGFLQAFFAKIGTSVGAGLAPAQKDRATTRAAPTPEEIFYYIYAVLYTPVYRKRYEEFLKIDFPRIPLPSNHEVFKALSSLGRELVDLHLLKHSALGHTDIGFPKEGSYKVEKVSYDAGNQRILINKDQYFGDVPKEIWEYRIGAYQVMEKYLKDRKGRKLSLDEINHYLKMSKAIQLTIEFQKKIDDIPLTPSLSQAKRGEG